MELDVMARVDVRLSWQTAMDVACPWISSDNKEAKRRRRSRPMKAALLRYHGVVSRRTVRLVN